MNITFYILNKIQQQRQEKNRVKIKKIDETTNAFSTKGENKDKFITQLKEELDKRSMMKNTKRKRGLRRRYTAQLSKTELLDAMLEEKSISRYDKRSSMLPLHVLHQLALDQKRQIKEYQLHMAVHEKPELKRWDSADFFMGKIPLPPRDRSASSQDVPCSPV